MKLVIYGAGGLGREVLDMALAMPNCPYDEFCFVDDGKEPGTRVNESVVAGGFDALSTFAPSQTRVVIAIGFPTIRFRLAQKIHKAGLKLGTVIDGSSLKRPSTEIGDGAIIAPKVFLSCNVRIGENVVVNTDTVIGHDSTIGAHSVIARCCIGGTVSIGEGVEIGVGTALFPCLKIGEWSKIAMGSGVFKDVPANSTVAGSPARVISKRERGWHDE